MNLPQKTVTSADGTTIADEISGQGPVVVLVSSALADRSDTRKRSGGRTVEGLSRHP
jgi:hypothetical protein